MYYLYFGVVYINWLIKNLINWLIDWSFDWSIHLSIDILFDWLIDWNTVVGLIGWLIFRWSDGLTVECINKRSIDWFVWCFVHWGSFGFSARFGGVHDPQCNGGRTRDCFQRYALFRVSASPRTGASGRSEKSSAAICAPGTDLNSIGRYHHHGCQPGVRRLATASSGPGEPAQ